MESQVKEHKVTKSPKRRNKSAQISSLPMKRIKSRKRLQYQTTIKQRSVAYILSMVQSKL